MLEIYEYLEIYDIIQLGLFPNSFESIVRYFISKHNAIMIIIQSIKIIIMYIITKIRIYLLFFWCSYSYYQLHSLTHS